MKCFAQALNKLASPIGCDTFVSFPPATLPGTAVFGKNSDRPAGEPQSIRRYAGKTYPVEAALQCTYISIPQIPQTHSILLSQLDWMWGAEMGANDCSVIIGNEAVWTTAEYEPPRSALVGMDFVRLGLERGASAMESLNIITSLLEKHGQSGPCAENDADFDYHNSYLICDPTEAWILETAGRHWVAKRHEKGVMNISNNLTIRKDYDKSSVGLLDYAKKKGWIATGEVKLDFAKYFSDGPANPSQDSRQVQGCKLLSSAAADGTTIGPEQMMDILRNHDAGICMHGSFETTAAMVSELHVRGNAKHWMTGKPHPCKNPFLEQDITEDTG